MPVENHVKNFIDICEEVHRIHDQDISRDYTKEEMTV
jgi:hypothetical protein